MADCLVALGANLGDCRASLRAATAQLAALASTRVVARSSGHATAPIGGPAGQGEFLNGAVRLRTSLSPQRLHAELLAIETRAGRSRAQHWEARTLDLDLLLYDEQLVASDTLVVPHPRMSYRRFVLAPAVEIAGEMRHPTSGWTLSALWRHLQFSAASIAVGSEQVQVADALRKALAEEFPDVEFTAYEPASERARLVVWIGDSPAAEVLAGPTAVLRPQEEERQREGMIPEAMVREAVAAALSAGVGALKQEH